MISLSLQRTRRGISFRTLILLAITCAIPRTATAQRAGDPPTGEMPMGDPPAAIVGDQPIYRSQVEWQFQQQFASRGLKEELADVARAKILDQLVDQQRVMDRLADGETKHLAHDDEVNLEIARFEELLRAREESLDGWLADNGQSMACLRFNVRWQISWQRYLNDVLTDKVLERYWERRQREFDGTRVHVAHLLLGVEAGANVLAVEEARQRAAEIRQQILSGETSWEEATRRHSTAPTADDGGDIGWIEFTRPMPPEFTRTAFALAVGEMSEPVQTTFGIHLIKCVEIEPGVLKWYHAKKAVRKAAVRDLFKMLADRQRPKTSVRFTGVTPWRDPETSKLMRAEPGDSAPPPEDAGDGEEPDDMTGSRNSLPSC